jgi:transposase
MVRALSNDLRERVVSAVQSGETSRAVAARFGVAVSSVVKWSQRHRATGSVSPDRMGGNRPRVLEPHRAFIAERIEQVPSLTLHKLKAELAERGVSISHDAIWRFLRREGLSFKKKRSSPLSRRGSLLRANASAGGLGCGASIRAALSSSTRLGSRPTWRRSGAGGQRALASAASPLTAIGAQ